MQLKVGVFFHSALYSSISFLGNVHILCYVHEITPREIFIAMLFIRGGEGNISKIHQKKKELQKLHHNQTVEYYITTKKRDLHGLISEFM